MQALILAGGQGSRLRPITDYIPKPLVPICNIPIIEWQIKYLQGFGVDEVIVCTGYKSGLIEDYLSSRKLGSKVRISPERTPLGTGGAIKKASKMLKGKSCFVMNGDVITDIDLSQMANTPDSIATIPMRTGYGTVKIDGDHIAGFAEKGDIPGVFMNAGIYHLSAKMASAMPRCGDAERTVFPRYAEAGKLHTVCFQGAIWHSVDSHKDLEECEKTIRKTVR